MQRIKRHETQIQFNNYKLLLHAVFDLKVEKKRFLSTKGFIYNYMITINTMDKMGKLSMTYNKINFLTI